MLLLGALLFPILLAFAGLAIDVGSVAAKRRDAQNAVDSFDFSGSNSITTTYSNYVPVAPPRLALVE